MIWQQIATKLLEAADAEAIRHMIKTTKSYRAPSIGLLNMWCEWTAISEPVDILNSYKYIQDIITFLYPNHETLHVYSIKWRRPIADRFGKKTEIYRQSVYQLGLSREESLKRRDDYTKKIRRNARKRVVKFTQQEVFDAIDHCIRVGKFGHQVAAVMLATGSRLVEVLKISEFNFVESGDQNTIRIDGIAKNKGDKLIERPLIRLTANQLLNLINQIRNFKDFTSMTNEAAKQIVIAPVNSVMKALFPEREITSHKCRYIWASLAWQLYGPEVPQQEWVREMLGHESGDMSLVYLMYNVILTKK